MDKLLSLCIPTNGVVEWVFPVLNSIYNQNIDESLYEVVVTDNGNNPEFKKQMVEYANNHKNLIYKETNAYSFLNEIESYRLANGEFIKFINHRTLLNQNSLLYYIDFVKNNIHDKPFIYYSNGELKLSKIADLTSFDSFVKKMSYWSSWSTGMAFWKSDFEKIADLPIEQYNVLFPHTNILFSQRKKQKYIIDDSVLLKEIPVDSSKKGKYDLYYAFSIEYILILLKLYTDGDILYRTYKYVKNKNLNFIADLYVSFNILKRKCSYDCSNFWRHIRVFYSPVKIRFKIVTSFIKRIILKIFHIN